MILVSQKNKEKKEKKNHKTFRERDNWLEINYLMFAQALSIFTLSAEKRVRCFVFIFHFAQKLQSAANCLHKSVNNAS